MNTMSQQLDDATQQVLNSGKSKFSKAGGSLKSPGYLDANTQDDLQHKHVQVVQPDDATQSYDIPTKNNLLANDSESRQIGLPFGMRLESRQSIYPRLDKVLLPTLNPTPRRLRSVLLHGITGVGKSQLAWDYVRSQCLSEFDMVFWLDDNRPIEEDPNDVHDPEYFYSRMSERFQEFKDENQVVPPKKDYKNKIYLSWQEERQQFLEWLKYPKKEWLYPDTGDDKECTWLIVLNDVTKWDIWVDCFQELGNCNGAIIITSRNQNWDIPGILKIEISPFTPDEGSQLLIPKICPEHEPPTQKHMDIGRCFYEFLDGNPWFLTVIGKQDKKTITKLHGLISKVNEKADLEGETELCESAAMREIYRYTFAGSRHSKVGKPGLLIVARIAALFKAGVRRTRFPDEIFCKQDGGSEHMAGGNSTPVMGAPKSQRLDETARSKAHDTVQKKSSRIKFPFKFPRADRNRWKPSQDVTTRADASYKTMTEEPSEAYEISEMRIILKDQPLVPLDQVRYEEGKKSLLNLSLANQNSKAKGLEVSMLMQRSFHFRIHEDERILNGGYRW